MEIYKANSELLKEKISRMKQDGINSLHIVSDFDRTLTRCFLDGKKIPSAIALIREGGYLTPDYVAKAFALYDEYHPIELDESLPYDYRANKMLEWWTRHKDLLVGSGMNKEVIENALNKYPKMFREGALVFFDELYMFKIPLLIFSAGVGNMIEGYLLKENKLYDNIHIISNTFKFDERGFAVGYGGEIIHVLNKSETKIHDEKYSDSIKNRRNIILLGDSISDLDMVADVKFKEIIKIGFLNENKDKKLDLYLKDFDVVITDDGSMDYVNELIKEIKR